MGKHIADQPRDRGAGTRAREYARIEREHGAPGQTPAARSLQRRAAEVRAGGRRNREFLLRERPRSD